MSALQNVIAVVDDDHRVRNGLRELLESASYEALSFESGIALLDSGDLARITCVVADIGMPKLDGFELRAILRREYPNLPVILITGRYELIEAIDVDPTQEILRKPFESAALLSTISKKLANA